VYDAPHKEAKKCHLDYAVLANQNGKCLMKIELHTGRSHQIRAQLAHISCPICGDTKYGKQRVKSTDDIALFAYKLEFIHPVSKEDMYCTSYPEIKGYWKGFAGFFPK
jgi:23S rRNA pseudouridine1911/1915/1917 synthase